MAKNKWTLDGSILTVTRDYDSMEFELLDLFPMFAEFEDVQQMDIANGAKQKLADGLAGKNYTTQETFDHMAEEWKRITVDRKWNVGRTGGGVVRKLAKSDLEVKLDKAVEAGTITRKQADDMLKTAEKIDILK